MWGVGCGVSDTVLGEVTECEDFRSFRLDILYVNVTIRIGLTTLSEALLQESGERQSRQRALVSQ